jgi:hypothetical protein
VKKVDNKTDEIIKAVTTAVILGSVAAAIRSLLVSNETLTQRIRNFFAGVFMAAFCGYALHFTDLSEFYKTIIVGVSSAFISTFWPVLERLAKRWLIKKGNNVISDSDDNKHID